MINMITGKKIAISLLVAISLSGCANNSGNENIKDANKVASIQVGKSTKTDVQSILGAPQYDEPDSNGDSLWTYQHISTSANPFGILLGGSIEEKNVMIRFGADGIVKGIGKGGNKI